MCVCVCIFFVLFSFVLFVSIVIAFWIWGCFLFVCLFVCLLVCLFVCLLWVLGAGEAISQSQSFKEYLNANIFL